MLAIKQLDFDYPDKPLLHQVQFTLNAGQLLHLRGNNGAGKSTLLKIIAGILQPSEGDILYQGHSIYNDIATYQQMICYVGHKLAINNYLTVEENCRFDLHYKRSPLPMDDLLKTLHLQNLKNDVCGTLSAGLRRRVALLRLVMSTALIWLLDEPFVALDQETLSIFMSMLSNHVENGGLIILTSHQPLPHFVRPVQEYCL